MKVSLALIGVLLVTQGCFEEPVRQYFPVTDFRPVDLPDATNATEITDRPDYEYEFPVTLESNGNATFKGNTWALASPDPMESEMAVRALRQEIMALDLRQPPPRVELYLHADHVCPWGWVESILAVTRKRSSQVAKLHVAVRPKNLRYLHSREFAITGTPRDLSETDAALTEVVLSESRRSELEKRVELTIDDTTFRFPQGPYPWDHCDSYDAEERDVWRSVAKVLDASAIQLRVTDGEIDFRYVIGLVDLLLERSDCTIALPDLDHAMDFEAPPKRAKEHVRERRVPRPAMILSIAVACAIAALLTFLPLMRRRSRRGL